MDLKEYYLVKCFTTEKYRDDFNNGVDIHINNNRQFWKKEKAFQQDLEGVVLKQNGDGILFSPKKRCEIEVEKIITGYSGKSLNTLVEELEKYGSIVGSTADFTMSVDGYICCFYLLRKTDIKINIENGSLKFFDSKIKDDFLRFLDKYARENKKHGQKCYASIYDAYAFMSAFSRGFKSIGYSIKYGRVSYSNVTVEKKIEAFNNSDYKTLLFTKPTKYSYQHEFRIFLPKKDNVLKDYLSESGIEMKWCAVLHLNII